MKRALVYARVSPRDQEGAKQSIDRQVKACRSICTIKEMTVAEVFKDERVSGFKKVERKGWNALRKAIESSKGDAVVVQAIDRAGRNTIELLQFVKFCKEHNVDFISATQQIDTTSQWGSVMLAIFAALAELEGAIKAERSLGKHADMLDAENGAEWSGGSKPFGYTVLPGRKLIPNPAEREAIVQAAQTLLNGGSINEVVRQWNAAGHRTGKGNLWIREGVKATLQDERLIGYRKPLIGRKPNRYGPSVRATWEPLLTRSDFERLADYFNSQRGTNMRHTDRYPLTGLLWCKACGGRLKGRPANGKRRYVCVATGSMHLSIVAEPTEEYVTSAASRVHLVDPATVIDLSQVAPELREERSKIEARLADIQRALENGELSAVLAGRAERSLEKRLVEIDTKIESLTPAGYAKLLEDDGTTERDVLDAYVDRIVVAPVSERGAPFTTDRVDIQWKPGVEALPDIPASERKRLQRKTAHHRVR